MLLKRTSAAVLILVAIIAGALVLSTSSVSDSSRPISLLIGASLGFVFERGRFCFFCLFRDATESRHTRPLLSVLTAIAVGAIGYAVQDGCDSSAQASAGVAVVGQAVGHQHAA